MTTIKIHAKLKSDFVIFKEVSDNGVKGGRLLKTEFFKWLEEKTNIYDKIALIIENNELIVAK